MAEDGEMTAHESDLQQAAEIIAGADALVIAAGAGMGVDSGLPDFRGNDGFWNAYPALAQAQLEFTEGASPRTFERDPALAWGFYGHRLKLYRDVQPHAGFTILKAWTEAKRLPGWVYTSNVDGQFQKAGLTAMPSMNAMVPCTTCSVARIARRTSGQQRTSFHTWMRQPANYATSRHSAANAASLHGPTC